MNHLPFGARTSRPLSSPWRLGAALAGLALGALACQNLPTQAFPDEPAWKRHPGFVLGIAYNRDLTAASKRKGEAFEKGEPAIDALGRRVFVGSSDGALYALNAETGTTLWRFQTLSFVESEPLYDRGDDAVYFGSHDGALYKVKARNGELVWRLSTNAEVQRRPVIVGENVYFTNANDTLVAADKATGRVVWSHHRAPALGMEVAGHSGPMFYLGQVYVAFSDGVATAYDATSGEERWRRVDLTADAEAALGETPKYLDVDTTPVAVELATGPAVIFGHYQGGVSALDAEMGNVLWSAPQVSGVSDLLLFEEPPRIVDGDEVGGRRLIIVSTGTTGLWGLDPETGTEVWRRNLPRGGVGRPAIFSGLLLFGATQLGLYAVSPVDGSVVDGIHLDRGVSSTPAALGRHAFVMTNGGDFWSIAVSAPGSSVPPGPEYRGATTF